MTLMISHRRSLKTRITLATLSIFLVSLWSLFLFARAELREDIERMLSQQQFSMVSTMATHINDEIAERLAVLNAVAQHMNPALMRDQAALQTYLEQLPIFVRNFNGGVIVVGPDGTALADTPHATGRIGQNYQDIDTIASALKNGQASVGRPVMGKKLKSPVIGMTVPLRDAQGQIIGALSGVTNLGKPNFLDQITGSRYGQTGGYVLVDKKIRLVVTATDKSRIMGALPPPGTTPLIDRYVQGFEGSGILVNVRGVKVLTSAAAVPLADWYVGVQLPTEEAFAPLYALQQRMLWATALLTLLAGALTWWMLKRQLAPLLTAASALANMSVSKQPPQPLPVTRQDEIGELITGFNHLMETVAKRDAALQEREERLRAITDNSGTMIYMKNLTGQYIYANRPFKALFHDTAPEKTTPDIQGKTDFDLFPPEVAHTFVQTDQRVAQTGQSFEVEEQIPHGDGFHTYLSVKFPLRRSSGEIYAVCGIATDITLRKKTEQELRIAAVAFESQEGIVVMDTALHFLRVNHAFTKITGFSAQEAEGKSVSILQSDRHPADFYKAIWDEIERTGHWQGELWQRRKNGENYAAQVTISSVTDQGNQVTHFVGNFTDATHSHLQEQQRLIDEAILRETLVREVHHRIKNNLQGITGLLRQFAKHHPETADTINQAIGQVQGISIIHGLHGRTGSPQVRLCELIVAIGGELQTLWQTPVALNLPPQWCGKYIVAESEAVPIALVLNELILNAIKHGGKAQGKVSVMLEPGTQPGVVQISITNAGQLPVQTVGSPHHNGLQLVRALLPHHGATLASTQHNGEVVTLLELAPPVISLELEPEKNHDYQP